jgi:trehalose 6-phosphate synthase
VYDGYLSGSAPFVIAVNRAVADLRRGEDGRIAGYSGTGGLMHVLGPALAGTDGLWIAAAISPGDRALARELRAERRPAVLPMPEGRVHLHLLDLPADDYEAYYRRIATEVLWFLQHELIEFLPTKLEGKQLAADWAAYRRTNQRFAEACAEQVASGGRVLVEDYQLALAPRWLRRARPDVAIAHHTMISWPEPETWTRLPDELVRELVDGLLGADMMCFLVRRWADAFIRLCARLGYVVDRDVWTVIDRDERPVAVRWFPVGADPERLAGQAASPDVAAHTAQLGAAVGDRRFIVRVERLEPSKNIVRGLDAFELLLERTPELAGRVCHFVLAYGSRAELPIYQSYSDRVHQRVRDINQRFGTASWQPVLLETENNFARGLAAMALADVLVVNPWRDGMNLVAKEGPIVNRRAVGLVLSTGAGAAEELADDAWTVDPLDIPGLATAMAAALAAPESERAARLQRLRARAGAMPPRRWLAESLAELERVRSAS